MNFRALDLNLLRVFDFMMRERNVTRAAARLAMTQPAVSNALRRLRGAVGDELFVPGPNGMQSTAQALALASGARGRRIFDPQPFDPHADERLFIRAKADATAAVVMPKLMALLQQELAALVHLGAPP